MSWLFQPLLPGAAQLQAGGGALTLTAAQGAFTLTGEAAGLKRALKLGAGQGSFALSGIAAALTVTTAFTAARGLFTLTGEAAGFVRALKLTAAQGSLTLAGQNASFISTAAATISQAVQLALYNALRAALPDLPLYDHVPYNQAAPFAVLVSQDITDDDTLAQFGYVHRLKIAIYSTYRGQKEVLELLDGCWQALHGVRLTISLGRAVVCRCTDQQTSLDSDGLTRRGDLGILLRTAA